MCGVSTPWESQSMVPTSPGRQTTLTVNTLGPGTYLSNLNPNIFFLGVSKQNMFVFLFVLLLRVSKPSYNLSYTSIWDHWNVSTTTLNDKYTPLNKDHVRLQRTPLNPTKKKKKNAIWFPSMARWRGVTVQVTNYQQAPVRGSAYLRRCVHIPRTANR